MHPECYAYVEKVVADLDSYRLVVEIGSRNINGTVRGLFVAEAYVGIDLYPGPGVDVVGDALDLKPSEPVDVVVCCEVLEHTPAAEQILRHVAGWLRPGGTLVTTMAGPTRAPHSALDGGPVRLGEFYRNVTEDELRFWLAPEFDVVDLEQDDVAGDLRAVAVKL